MSRSFTTVAPTWNPCPSGPPRRRMAVTAHSTASPRGSAGAAGWKALAYWPNAIAASATGAAKPKVAVRKPAMKPKAGPKARPR